MGLSPIFGKLGTSPASSSSSGRKALLIVGVANSDDLVLRYYKPGSKTPDTIDVAGGVSDETKVMNLIESYERKAAKDGGYTLNVNWPLLGIWTRSCATSRKGEVVYTCRLRVQSALDFGPQVLKEYTAKDGNPSSAFEATGKLKAEDSQFGRWSTQLHEVSADEFTDLKKG